MATAQFGTLLQHIHKLAAGRRLQQRTDRQLLEDFSASRDEAAFAALVARHGPMVLRVCRRVLRHEQDAEDAFQATFVVLARQTGSIRKREALAEWLHGVAYRTAMKARRSAARRRNHETRLWTLMSKAAVSPSWDDVQAVLDEEIQHLPAPFRAAFVLCVLEGKCAAEAAAELGCKAGTVSSRLTRARQRLQGQLARRGIKLAALLAALSVAESAAKAAVPPALAVATLRFGLLVAAGGTAAGVIPSHVAALAAGVTRAMFLTKAKFAVAMLVAVGVVAGAGALARQALAAKEDPKPSAEKPQKEKSPASTKPPTADRKESFTYKGRVLGPDGKPFAGAKLYLAVPEAIAKNRPVRATTGTDGRFEFTVSRAEFTLPREAPADVDVFAFLQVVAVAKGYGPDWTPMPSGKRPSGDLALRLVKNDVTVKGRILDLQGKPVAGVKVNLLRLETTAEDDLTSFLKAWKTGRSGYLPENLLSKVWLDPSLAALPKTVTTDADGRFSLPGAGNDRIMMLSVESPQIERTTFRVLPRSAAEVKALADAASEGAMRGMIRGGPSPTIYGLTFDHLAYPARVIVGTVRDKETGKPLAGVRISGRTTVAGPITPARPPVARAESRSETYTDKQGRYQLQGLGMAEKCELLVWPSEFSTYLRGGKEIGGSRDLAKLTADFELMRGVEVRGRITDKVTGKPVNAGVRYRPAPDNNHPGAAFFRMVGKGCDGPPGTFREVVPPGSGVFLVSVRPVNDEFRYTQARLDPADKAKTVKIALNEFFDLNGMNAYRVIEVAADAKSMTCNIQVDPGRSLTGTVLGPDGKPLSGVIVKGLTAVWPKPTALKESTFKVLALDPPEPRELLFVHKERKLAGKLVIRGDEKDAVTVRLEPWGALTGRILDEDGQPLAGVQIHLFFPQGTFIQPVTWWAGLQGEDVRTDRDGRFRAEGLTPGKKFHLSAASKTKFLPLSGTTGLDELSVRSGETKDLGELKAKPE